MNPKKQTVDKIVYYQSNLLNSLDINHGFFTRLGGVSSGPFYSLNFKKGIGDSDENVIKNRQAACQALNSDYKRLVYAKLAHGNNVYVAEEKDASNDIQDVDCLLTIKTGLSLAISVADCLPIIVADSKKRFVAIIHGGWRSLVGGIIPKAIGQMKSQFNCLPEELVAAIGPGIGVDSYPIGQEVTKAVTEAIDDPSSVLVTSSAQTHLDLRKLAELQLQTCGVFNIDHINIDTATHTDEFYSHRAEKGQTGRFGAIVSL